MDLQLGFSFVAGLLTTLSPCVLPILPFLMGSALRKNKKAPLYMVIGLATSFVIVGFALSRFGTLLGLDSDQIRKGSAVILMLTSIFFLSEKVQTLISEKLTFFANLGSAATNKWKLDESSNWGSLILGGLLGVIWSPCAGPTLGVAVSLASQNGANADALQIMIVYAIGAAIQMLLISYGLRSFFQKYQSRIVSFSEKSKIFFGIILLGIGIFIFFGLDKSIEAFLLNYLPETWVDLITKY
ncbi:MAG: cytochrome c biogenesis protein CcdA [Bdellovibrionaceae bacterium]|nr:cytochrome c biogenesis protein CcdA [Pseudobdellovibrionaceae bacterium]